MATIRVHHTIGALERDLVAAAARVPVEGPGVVWRNAEEGNRLARNFAIQAAGPHGKNYFERVTAEMTGGLTAEFGPSAVLGLRYTGVAGNVGAGRDLDKSAAIIGPKFGRDAGALLDGIL